jgi:hypothetical protein
VVEAHLKYFLSTKRSPYSVSNMCTWALTEENFKANRVATLLALGIGKGGCG